MSKNFKVCFIQFYGYSIFNPNFNIRVGGAEVDLYNISLELSMDNDFEVFYLTGDFGQKTLEKFNNIKVIKSHTSEKTVKNYLRSSFIFFKRLHQINSDVYITAGFSIETGLVSFFCKLFNRVHIHRTEHERDFNRHEILKKVRKCNLHSLIGLLGYFNIDQFIVQNKDHQKLLRENFNFPSIVIRNSYSIPNRARYKKEIILWVARGKRWKRPEIFLKLAKNFSMEKFVMIMPFRSDKKYYEMIKRKAEKIENLKFLGGLPFPEVEEYYKKAKVFINTSIAEGFPNTFNQSMNFSTPILSLNVNPDNFLDKYNAGIYCHNNVAELKEGLNELLSNSSFWEEKSNNAYNYVKEEMNIVKNIKIWKKVILFHCNKKYKKSL